VIFFLLFVTCSFVLGIVHHNQSKKSSKINRYSSGIYDFMHFGGHIGFLAAILDLRQNLRWPMNVFQTVRAEVHKPTEKTLLLYGYTGLRRTIGFFLATAALLVCNNSRSLSCWFSHKGDKLAMHLKASRHRLAVESRIINNL